MSKNLLNMAFHTLRQQWFPVSTSYPGRLAMFVGFWDCNDVKNGKGHTTCICWVEAGMRLSMHGGWEPTIVSSLSSPSEGSTGEGSKLPEVTLLGAGRVRL